MSKERTNSARPASSELRVALQHLIERRGLLGAASDLSVSRNTLASVAAGAGAREGTLELLRSRVLEHIGRAPQGRVAHLQLADSIHHEPASASRVRREYSRLVTPEVR
jgi:hypothetical protein